jgi:hypothetical protein
MPAAQPPSAGHLHRAINVLQAAPSFHVHKYRPLRTVIDLPFYRLPRPRERGAARPPNWSISLSTTPSASCGGKHFAIQPPRCVNTEFDRSSSMEHDNSYAVSALLIEPHPGRHSTRPGDTGAGGRASGSRGDGARDAAARVRGRIRRAHPRHRHKDLHRPGPSWLPITRATWMASCC